MPEPRTIRLVSGREVELCGDLVPILDALYQDVAAVSAFDYDYLKMRKEIDFVLDQLTKEELSQLAANSLFLNYVSYENEMAARIIERMGEAAERSGAANP